MWYLKDMKSGRIITTRKVDPAEPGDEECSCYTDEDFIQLESIEETTMGLPIVLTSEEEVSEYLEDYKRDFPDWNIKAFKLMEVEWE